MELFLIILGGIALFAVLFIGVWLLVSLSLFIFAGLSKELNVETGSLLRESSWGSGSLNGLPVRNTMRVAEYEKGWIVRMAPIFGGGKLWLAKEGAEVSEINEGNAFKPQYRTINSGDNRVRLTGALADFVKQTH